MVAKICSDGASSRSAACEIHQALPKLRDQLQSRRRHGALLHRETKRHRSRETLERIREIAFIPTPPKRINELIRKPGTQESRNGISEIEGKAARVAASESGSRASFNRGMERADAGHRRQNREVAARERGRDRVQRDFRDRRQSCEVAAKERG